MFERVWLCLTVVLLPTCLAYPASGGGVGTTCDDLFRGEENFDPRLALGNWTTVSFLTTLLVRKAENFTEISNISELTPAELEQYRDIVKDYPDAKIKLKLAIHDVSASIILDVVTVLIPEETSGKINGWVTYIKKDGNQDGNELRVTQPPVQFTMRLKIADGFLIVMLCETKEINIMSRSGIFDEAKLLRVAADHHIEGVGGKRVYPYTSA